MRFMILVNTLLIVSQCAIAQVELTTNNPAPRAGDEIKISFKIKDLDEKIAEGELKILKTINQTGPVTIGPFNLKIGDKVYETDALRINVVDKLPDNVRDGLWMRLVEVKGVSFLIIEQRISNQWKKGNSNNETTLTLGEVKHADFNEELLIENGLEIITSNSSSGTQVINEKDAFGKGTVSYKIQIFEFTKTPDFKKRFKIDRKAFINFPDNLKVEEIWIE